MKRKRKLHSESWQTSNHQNGTYAPIYEDLMLSEAWRDLSNAERVVLLCCHQQYYGHHRPEADIKSEMITDDCFYFSRNDLPKYGMAAIGGTRFDEYMASLKQHGFIQQVPVYRGAGRGEKNIYEKTISLALTCR